MKNNITALYELLNKIETDYPSLVSNLKSAKRKLDKIDRDLHAIRPVYTVVLYDDGNAKPGDVEYFSNLSGAKSYVHFLMRCELELPMKYWEHTISANKETQTYTFDNYTIKVTTIHPQESF